MTRFAVALLVTLIALGTLIVVAGRTNWYAMSFRMASDAIDVVDAVTVDDTDAAPAATATLSDPATWSPDFMRGAIASAECPTDTLPNVRTRMAAIGPYEVDDFERTVAYYSSISGEPGEGIPIHNRVSELVRRSIDPADRIYAFGFTSLAAGGSAREYSGYFVARGDCIVHVQVTRYEN